jgi:hypothetical protein
MESLQMRKPWLKKNPFMSMWSSGAEKPRGVLGWHGNQHGHPLRE